LQNRRNEVFRLEWHLSPSKLQKNLTRYFWEQCEEVARILSAAIQVSYGAVSRHRQFLSSSQYVYIPNLYIGRNDSRYEIPLRNIKEIYLCVLREQAMTTHVERMAKIDRMAEERSKAHVERMAKIDRMAEERSKAHVERMAEIDRMAEERSKAHVERMAEIGIHVERMEAHERIAEKQNMSHNRIENGDCLICLGSQFLNDSIILPCSHAFHFHCISSWFDRKLSCPTCRALFIAIHPF